MTRLLRSRLIALLALSAALFGAGCASTQPSGSDYFSVPSETSVWNQPIRGWQARSRAVASPSSGVAPALTAGLSAPLYADYEAFRSERRRALAREVVGWVQGLARERYVPDGPVDYWPTLPELMASHGEDCDGLELLAYHTLLDMGFPPDRVYRGIVHRESDGQHHMVTFWFEEPGDPWVLDPTGAVGKTLVRMSGAPDWEALQVFDEDSHFSVRARP